MSSIFANRKCGIQYASVAKASNRLKKNRLWFTMLAELEARNCTPQTAHLKNVCLSKLQTAAKFASNHNVDIPVFAK